MVRAGRSEEHAACLNRSTAITPKVVSAKAYTQGLVWLIAGAHPMGYSNLQFGYWSRDPHDPNGPNGQSTASLQPCEVLREPVMADNFITCDVAIVGSGFAGSFIANELSKKGIKVVILEAGPDVQPNFNDYMKSFYEASSKVPESPYPPAVL